MFNKEIDVASIMKEIQGKALNKRKENFNNFDSDLNNPVLPEIDTILAKLIRINNLIIETYDYTKEHEETAHRLNCNRHSALSRKLVVFIKRCVRKLTKFIWLEQNEVNKSLNANIKALCDSQIELTKSLNIINSIIVNQRSLRTDLDNLQDAIGNCEARTMKK